jgi:AcrR family transcriptional regulator
MRDRIKALALDLLIQHGYRGVSFGDLAAALDTTRANIHYHFGHKQTLVEEVLLDYVRDTTAAMREIWTLSDAPFAEKIARNIDYSRRRYARYNKPGREGRNWSLIARMRQDSAVLTPAGHSALLQFSRDLSDCITGALEAARRRGEFVSWMPVEDVALQLVGIANSAAPITQDAGTFDRLEQLYSGFTRLITHAYGAGGPRPRRAVRKGV